MQSNGTSIPGRGPLVVACSECGSCFRTFPSQAKVTCSAACRGKRHTRLAHERNSRPCVICGVMFYDSPGAFENEGRQACSLACRNVALSMARRSDPIERFWGRVTKTDSCWTHSGGRLNGGYTAFSVNGVQIRSSRYAWMIATGESLTSSDVIGHVCDNPPCVRNDDVGVYEVSGVLLPRRGHLFKGTGEHNRLDMLAKKRSRPGGGHMMGTTNPNAKLTESDVRAIRALHAEGIKALALAAQYGVTPTMIHAIVKRRNWKHLD